MSQCLGCNRVEGPAHVLHDGTKVCTSCPEWRMECEAREILALAHQAGRDAAVARLSALSGHRVGSQRVEALRDRVNSIRESIRGKPAPRWLTGGV